MITALFFAAATAALPSLPPVSGTGSLGTPANPAQFTFYVGGDNRPDSGDAPSPGFEALIPAMQIAMKTTPAAFVLWGGDIIKGKKSSDAKTQYPLVLPWFAKLGVPVFNVPGNHELDKKGSGDCHDAADDNTKLLDDYTSSVSQPYGWFQYGNSVFVGVNTEEMPGKDSQPSGCFNGYVSTTQLSLIQEKFAAVPKGTNVFLFMHRPTQDNNSHAMQPDPADQSTKYGKKVLAFVNYVNALKNPNVVYVFASHDHRYYQAVAGTASKTGFVVTGGGGAPLSGCPDKGRPGAYYHWLQVAVNGATVTVTPVPLTNNTPCGAPPQ